VPLRARRRVAGTVVALALLAVAVVAAVMHVRSTGG
jgi:hypothetical protein